MKNNQTVYMVTLVAMVAVTVTCIVHACILGIKYFEKQ